jgi:hypothetical protein
MVKYERRDGRILIETEFSEYEGPDISDAEHEEAMRVWQETGCVPAEYASKIASGHLFIKGSVMT